MFCLLLIKTILLLSIRKKLVDIEYTVTFKTTKLTILATYLISINLTINNFSLHVVQVPKTIDQNSIELNWGKNQFNQEGSYHIINCHCMYLRANEI